MGTGHLIHVNIECAFTYYLDIVRTYMHVEHPVTCQQTFLNVLDVLHAEPNNVTFKWLNVNTICWFWQTKEQDGILFYGAGSHPHPHHVAISLYQGSAYISVSFADDVNGTDSLETNTGWRLNDNVYDSPSLLGGSPSIAECSSALSNDCFQDSRPACTHFIWEI